MEDVWQYLIDHWEWNIVVLLLMFVSWLLGGIWEVRRINLWLEKHSERLAELWADEMSLKELEKEDE